jgi:alkylhydroperoxidase family enzyme
MKLSRCVHVIRLARPTTTALLSLLFAVQAHGASGEAAPIVSNDTAKAPEHARATLPPLVRRSAYIEEPGSRRGPGAAKQPRLPPLLAVSGSDGAAVGTTSATPLADVRLIQTLAHSAGRPAQFFPLFNYVEVESGLPARDRELLFLRTAWLAQSPYLWARHATRAAQTGMTPADIRAVASRERADRGKFDRVLADLVDELYRKSAVSERTWSAVMAHYGLQQTMDAVVTVTQATESAMLANALGVRPEDPHGQRLPGSIRYQVSVADREPPLTSARVLPVEGKDLSIALTLRQNPTLAARWYAISEVAAAADPDALPAHDRELIVLRMGWNCQSDYEWAQHVGRVGRAREHGLEPLDIARGVVGKSWTDRDRTLISAVDEFYRDATLSEASWKKLSALYPPGQLIAMTSTAARYRRLSMTLNAFGVQPLAGEEWLPVLKD